MTDKFHSAGSTARLLNLASMLRPQSIAVIGAADEAMKTRGRPISLLKEIGYSGAIYPVHRVKDTVQGLKAYSSIAAVPGPVDLAIVIVPAEQLVELCTDCASAGVKSVVILSGVPLGVQGDSIQSELESLASRTEMRILGPNTLGYMNPESKVVATFAPNAASHGSERLRQVGVVSQSGGIGYTLYDQCHRAGLGIRQLIMTGNEVDVDALEVADQMLDEGGFSVIMMFIEGFKRAERLAAVAAKAADRQVPLIVLKVGRSTAGQRAAVSHTAHLTGSDTAVDAMFDRYGVIRVDDLDEMVTVACALWKKPKLEGDKVAIITTGGGLGGILADTCASIGIDVPEFDLQAQEEIGKLVPEYGSPKNPIDLPGGFINDRGPAVFADLIASALSLKFIDAVIVIASMNIPGRGKAIRERFESVIDGIQKPILFHSADGTNDDSRDHLAALGVHFYTVTGCAKALHAIRFYCDFQKRWQQPKKNAPAKKIVAFEWSALGSGAVDAKTIDTLLAAFDVPRPPEAIVASAEDASSAAVRIGFPVALKVQSKDIPHKTDAGAIALGLNNAEVVQTAFERVLDSALKHAPDARIEGVQIQRMMPPGVEMAIGMINDADYGPQIMLALGGIYIDLLGDSVFAPVPVGPQEARRMISRLKMSKLLDGVRGQAPSDVDALAEVIVSVSQMVEAAGGRFAEIDFNPVLVYPKGQGVSVVDALIVAQ